MTDIDWALTWNMIQAVSTALTAIAVVVTLVVTAFFAMQQLHLATSARHAGVLGRIQEILGNADVVAAREIVKSQNFDADSLNEQQRKAVELVTRSFDRAGYYLSSKLIPEELVLPEYPGALWHWEKLEHYVKRQREVEGYEARRFFEYMALRTKVYRQKHGLSL